MVLDVGGWRDAVWSRVAGEGWRVHTKTCPRSPGTPALAPAPFFQRQPPQPQCVETTEALALAASATVRASRAGVRSEATGQASGHVTTLDYESIVVLVASKTFTSAGVDMEHPILK